MGMTKLERIGVVATGPLQLLLTAASMVGCINAIVGGVTVALALRSLPEAPVPAAAATGALVALALAALRRGAHTVMTILPRVLPASSARMASGASPSG
jgi:hypothetical protein